jgi:hypothetical protein
VPSARALWGWVAIVSAVVVAVAISVEVEAGAYTQVGLIVAAAAPLVIVAAVGVRFRVMPLLALGSAGYAAWLWLDVAGDDARLFWPLAAAWGVAVVVALAAWHAELARARRRRERRRSVT